VPISAPHDANISVPYREVRPSNSMNQRPRCALYRDSDLYPVWVMIGLIDSVKLERGELIISRRDCTMNKRTLNIYIAGIFLAGIFSTQVQPATLNIATDPNPVGQFELLGAFDVDVGGSLFDVAFVDGSCISLFNESCYLSGPPFTFNTDAAALDAATALLDQVLVGHAGEGDIFLFDSDPTLTIGCGGTICQVYTPYLGFQREAEDPTTQQLGISIAQNTSGFHVGDSVSLGLTNINDDTSGGPGGGAVYAIWTPVNPIPIPAAIWLFGTALIGLVGFGKRRIPKQ
jgi:hypothetical protein